MRRHGDSSQVRRRGDKEETRSSDLESRNNDRTGGEANDPLSFSTPLVLTEFSCALCIVLQPPEAAQTRHKQRRPRQPKAPLAVHHVVRRWHRCPPKDRDSLRSSKRHNSLHKNHPLLVTVYSLVTLHTLLVTLQHQTLLMTLHSLL